MSESPPRSSPLSAKSTESFEEQIDVHSRPTSAQLSGPCADIPTERFEERTADYDCRPRPFSCGRLGRAPGDRRPSVIIRTPVRPHRLPAWTVQLGSDYTASPAISLSPSQSLEHSNLDSPPLGKFLPRSEACATNSLLGRHRHLGGFTTLEDASLCQIGPGVVRWTPPAVSPSTRIGRGRRNVLLSRCVLEETSPELLSRARSDVPGSKSSSPCVRSCGHDARGLDLGLLSADHKPTPALPVVFDRKDMTAKARAKHPGVGRTALAIARSRSCGDVPPHTSTTTYVTDGGRQWYMIARNAYEPKISLRPWE